MRLLLIQFVLLVLGLVGYCIATEIGFEAEDADEIVAIMEIYEDKKASGGMYISAGKGGGGRHPGKADFVINVRTPGQYTMWGAGDCPGYGEGLFPCHSRSEEKSTTG